MSTIRSPNWPLTATTAVSPGSSRFCSAASIPALPGAGRGTQAWFGRLHHLRQGRLDLLHQPLERRVEVADGGAGERRQHPGRHVGGPGPIRIRRGGSKLLQGVPHTRDSRRRSAFWSGGLAGTRSATPAAALLAPRAGAASTPSASAGRRPPSRGRPGSPRTRRPGTPPRRRWPRGQPRRWRCARWLSLITWATIGARAAMRSGLLVSR